METAGASPYGTRSRNRTGNTRPNYAEDREFDIEYEWNPNKKAQSAYNVSLPNGSHSGGGDKVSSAMTRRSSATALHGTMPNNKNPTQSMQNSIIPGMSSFSAYSDPSGSAAPPAPSRKRKAPGTGSATTQVPPAATLSTVPSAPRRNGLSPQANRLRPTNLMTFETCQGYLKNGKLKADDGTVLAVNGAFSDFPFAIALVLVPLIYKQIKYILSVNRPANPTIWPVLWSFSTSTTTQMRQSTLYASIGSFARETYPVKSMIQGLFLRPCNPIQAQSHHCEGNVGSYIEMRLVT